jgi:hypothetical protein
VRTWNIRLSGPKPVGFKDQPVECLGLSMGQHANGTKGIWGFSSREAAVAWVLRYLDARIVDTAADLSFVEPTCFIELVEDSHG